MADSKSEPRPRIVIRVKSTPVVDEAKLRTAIVPCVKIALRTPPGITDNLSEFDSASSAQTNRSEASQ